MKIFWWLCQHTQARALPAPSHPGLPPANPSVCAAVHWAGDCSGTGGSAGTGGCGDMASPAESDTGWQGEDGAVGEAAQRLGSPHQGPVHPGLTSVMQEIYQNATKCAPHPMVNLICFFKKGISLPA